MVHVRGQCFKKQQRECLTCAHWQEARWQVKAPAAHQLCRCALLEPQQSLHISSHEHVSLARQTEGKGCISTACTCGAQAVESAAMDV